MKILKEFINRVLFHFDLKTIDKAVKEQKSSGGVLVLKTKKIPVNRLVGAISGYIYNSEENISLVVPFKSIKTEVVDCFDLEVPCMTLSDFYDNIENYTYEDKTFMFLPVPLTIQSRVYDLALTREFNILFCE